MKKVLCLILILSMVFSLNIFSVNADQSVLDEELMYKYDVLKQLGFIAFEFNSDNINSVVTREEAVDSVIKTCSYGVSQDTRYEQYTYFNDINDQCNYKDSIFYAVERGIVSVNEDRMFEPERAVTEIELVTFILRAAGYKIYAEVDGGYPLGYIKIAKRLGLRYESEKNVNRARFVEILFNALQINVLEQKVYGDDNEYSNDGKDVLGHFHNIYKVEGKVDATFVSSVFGTNPVAGDVISIDGRKYVVENGEYAELLGFPVVAYYKVNEETGISNILHMGLNQKFDIVYIQADDISGFSNLTYTYGERKKQIKISPNHNLIVNGVRTTEYKETDFIPPNGYVVLIGENNIYDTVVVNTFRDYFLQRLGVGGSDKITVTEYETLRRFEINLFDDEKVVAVYKNNEKVDMQPFEYEIKGEIYKTTEFVDVPEGSVASIFSDKYESVNGWIIPARDSKHIRIYIYTPEVYGICKSISNDEIKIDEKKYRIADTNMLQKLKPNDEGYFVLNFDGKVFAKFDNRYLNDVSYAYLINAAVEGVLGKTIKTKILTENNKIGIYNVANKVKTNGKVLKDAEKVYDILSNSAKSMDPSFTISQPIKVRFNENNEVCEIWTVGNIDGTIKRDGERRKFTSRKDNGYMLYTSATAYYLKPQRIFEVPETETFKDDDYKVLSDWLPNYDTKLLDVLDVNLYKVPELVVSYTSGFKSTVFREILMVSEVMRALSDEGSVVDELRGYDGYDEVYYYSEVDGIFDGLKEGDVIKISGSGEEIVSWEYICKIDDVINHDFSSEYGKQTSGIYEIYSVNGNDFTLQHDALLLGGNMGQRVSQMGIRWTTEVESFINGAVHYDASKRQNKIEAFQVHVGVPNVIQTVKNVGNENCTKMYLRMENGMVKFIALYNGI